MKERESHCYAHADFIQRPVLCLLASVPKRAKDPTSLAIDSDPNAEPFYRACGALRFGSVPHR